MAGEQPGYLATITYKTSTSTVSAVAVAKLTNVGVSVDGGTIDFTNRDSTGRWREKFAGFKEWTANAEYVFADANATQEGIYSVLDSALKQTITFYPGGSTGGGTSFAGTGFVVGWDATGPDEEPVAHSIEIEGTGGFAMST